MNPRSQSGLPGRKERNMCPRGERIFGLVLCVLMSGSLIIHTGEQPPDLRINRDRLNRRIEELASFGATADGGVHRIAFSEEDKNSRPYLISLMKDAGLSVRIDEAGNIIGRREGTDPDRPVIMCGSHSDTVPQGGRYDGALGVLSAIESARVIHEHAITLRHPLEIVVFTDEEGGLVGSRAMTGTLTPDALDVVSHSGKTVRDGIKFIGGDAANIHHAVRNGRDIRAFLEIHIEQGGRLASSGINIGIVEGIVGINWWDVDIEGFANHAGTTPMDKRSDALLSAAHFIISVNRIVTSISGNQVGTVGRISALPGAPNVIPGHVRLSLELRDLSADKIRSLFVKIKHEADTIAQTQGTPITFSAIDATAFPAPTDPLIRDLITQAADDLGFSRLLMPSGAGHDAQDMAGITPTGMIFVPSVGGISHSPKEYTSPDDCAGGADVLLRTILKIDRSEKK
jgi:N-carbamoyl-L-amino-acid hydrolase